MKYCPYEGISHSFSEKRTFEKSEYGEVISRRRLELGKLAITRNLQKDRAIGYADETT